MAIRKQSPPPKKRVEQVVLAHRALSLRPFWYMVGTIERAAIGDQVLVRFGEAVVYVPVEWLVPADT